MFCWKPQLFAPHEINKELKNLFSRVKIISELMNTEHAYWSVTRWGIQFSSAQGKEKGYQFNQGQRNMWPRVQVKHTPTSRRNRYISLILSFRREKMKLGVTSDTGHSSPECAALIRWMRRLQQGADIFLISASISHPSPSSFSLPTSCSTFPPSSSTPAQPALPLCASPSLCTGMSFWEHRLMSWVFPWAWSVF